MIVARSHPNTLTSRCCTSVWSPPLEKLAPYLSAEQCKRSLQIAKTIKGKGFFFLGGNLSRALAALAPGLSVDGLSKAAQIIAEITDDELQVEAICSISDRLNTNELVRALPTARRMRDSERRTVVLAHLANRFDDPLRSEVFVEAMQSLLDALKKLSQRKSFEYQDGSVTHRPAVFPELSQALQLLASRLATDQFVNMLDLVDAVGDEEARVSLLSDFAPHIPTHLCGKVLDRAIAIKGDSIRSRALARLAGHLPETLIADAFKAAKLYHGSDALVSLAPRLSKTEVGEAFQVAKEWGSQAGRSVIRELAPRLSSEQIEEVVQLAKGGSFGSESPGLMEDLASRLSARQITEALLMARTIGDAYARLRVMLCIALHVPDEFEEAAIVDALRAAGEIPKEYDKAYALAALIPLLDVARVTKALQEVSAAKWGGDWAPRILKKLASHLSADQAIRLVSIGKTSAHRAILPRAIAALAPCLATEQRQREVNEAFDVAKELDANYERKDGLVDLAPYLSSEQIAEALESVREIPEFSTRAKALGELASFVSPERKQAILDELYSEALAMEDEKALADGLAALAPYLPHRSIEKAVRAVQSIKNEKYRSSAIRALVLALPRDREKDDSDKEMALQKSDGEIVALGLSERKRMIAEALRSTNEDVYWVFDASGEFEQKLEYLVQVAPDLPSEKRKELVSAALDMRRSDFDRRRALVILAPILDKGEIFVAFSNIRSFEDDSDRCKVISALAPQLGPEKLAEAFQIARGMADAVSRAKTLVALLPDYPSEQKLELVNDALRAAGAIGGVDQRAEVLVALTPFVTAASAPSFMASLLDTSAETKRETSLASMQTAMPLLNTFGGQPVLVELQRTINDVCRWYP